jgi:hypothetical protein
MTELSCDIVGGPEQWAAARAAREDYREAEQKMLGALGAAAKAAKIDSEEARRQCETALNLATRRLYETARDQLPLAPETVSRKEAKRIAVAEREAAKLAADAIAKAFGINRWKAARQFKFILGPRIHPRGGKCGTGFWVDPAAVRVLQIAALKISRRKQLGKTIKASPRRFVKGLPFELLSAMLNVALLRATMLDVIARPRLERSALYRLTKRMDGPDFQARCRAAEIDIGNPDSILAHASTFALLVKAPAERASVVRIGALPSAIVGRS